jgi:hypothetical protein
VSNSPFHHRDLKRALYDEVVKLLDSGGIAAVTIRATARAVLHKITPASDAILPEISNLKRPKLSGGGQGRFTYPFSYL